MSETLTEPALGDTPVGDGTAVGAGSVDGEEVVPASRFNGLMASFNKAKDEATQAQGLLAEALARAEAAEAALSANPHSTEADVSEVQELKEQVSLLSNLLLKNAQKDVFEEFPEAKPFADLIQAGSPEEMRELAKTIAERVKAAAPQAPTTASETPAETPAEAPAAEAPTGAPAVEVPTAPSGGQTVQGNPSAQDKVTEAIKRRSFKDWLYAAVERDGLAE